MINKCMQTILEKKSCSFQNNSYKYRIFWFIIQLDVYKNNYTFSEKNLNKNKF